jgi:hypothetical protein
MNIWDALDQLERQFGADVYDYEDTDRGGHARACVDVCAPLGQIWLAAREVYEDGHCLYVSWKPDAPQKSEGRLRSLLERMRQGLGACEDPTCFVCRPTEEER